MSAVRVEAFAALRDQVAGTLRRVPYATMTTVDRKGRPRARVLIAVWELDGDRPVGWLATYRTPVKAAHLAHNPHVTLSHWSPAQDTVAFDAVATWSDDAATRRRVWRLYREGSPAGVGYDPGAYWSGPDDPQYHVLRLDPWRVQALRGQDLATGRPARIWRSPEEVTAVAAGA
jgi:general stress protein 26